MQNDFFKFISKKCILKKFYDIFKYLNMLFLKFFANIESQLKFLLWSMISHCLIGLSV